MRRLRFQISEFFHVSSFIFEEDHVLIQKDNPSENLVIVEEELDIIDRYDIGNFVDLLRLLLINEECLNSEVAVDGGERASNITKLKKPGA